MLEKRIADGEIIGPRVKNSGFLEGKSPFSAHAGFVVDSVDEAKARVRWYAAHGFWGIKIYNSMNPDFVKPIADEAHRLGLRVSGHVPAFMTAERAIRDGYDEISHINQLVLDFLIDRSKDDTRTTFRFTAVGERMQSLDLRSDPVQRLIALMKERKTALDPTLAIFSPVLLSRPGTPAPADAPWLITCRPRPASAQDRDARCQAGTVPRRTDASWKKLEEMLLMLHETAFGSFRHRRYRRDGAAQRAEAWVKAGIPASAVLSMATLGGARFLGVDGQQGTVAPGKLADLYLVNGNPTQDIGRSERKARRQGRQCVYPDEIHELLGIRPFEAHAAIRMPATK